MAKSFLPLVRKAIAKGFKGRLSAGKLRQRVTVQDDFNDSSTVSFTDYRFDGIRENFDAAYQQRALIPETDVKVLVLLGSLPSTVVPVQDDEVFIDNGWFRVRRVLEIDPADASASLQCYQIPTPSL